MDDLAILKMDLGQQASDLGAQFNPVDRGKLPEKPSRTSTFRCSGLLTVTARLPRAVAPPARFCGTGRRGIPVPQNNDGGGDRTPNLPCGPARLPGRGSFDRGSFDGVPVGY